MTRLNKKLMLSLISAVILAPVLFAYFYGPKSELTLLSKAHYNTLFVFTPCLGSAKTYDDGYIKFNYTLPPVLLSHTAAFFIDPFYRGAANPFHDATEVADLDLPFKPSYKYKTPAGAPGLEAPGSKTVGFKKGKGVLRTEEPSLGSYGPEYLYILVKNGYMYRVAMPFYPERVVDRSWFFPALYHSRILSHVMPGSFTDLLPPRGFLNWFFTPCADKQMFCSASAALQSIEVAD